jgi:DNA replication protein DnaC
MSVGCFAHDRRKFVEATEAASRDRGSRNLANKAVHDIRQIFMWEEHITNLPAEEQQQIPSYQELSFEERLGLLVDRECSKRKNNKIKRLIRQARFQNSEACIENIHYHPERRLKKQQMLELASCQYIHHARNVAILGATGAGKSYLGQALGQAACRLGITTRYVQLADMLDELSLAKERSIEAFTKLKKYYDNVRLLIIDELNIPT